MRVHEFISEDADTGAYQQMQQFVKANQIPGIPADQQVALALFKELQKQKAQNNQLSSELDAAEERIDLATQSGELQGKELGMHRGELERERKAGAQQRATVDQLGQQYAQRTKASEEQIQNLTAQLDAVKSKPGIDPKVVAELEKQIKEINKGSIAADRVDELENIIANIQQQHKVDIDSVNELEQQIKSAKEAAEEAQQKTKELEKTKGGLSQEIESQLAHFKDVEKTVTGLRREINDLENLYRETDATVYDLEDDVYKLRTAFAAKNAIKTPPQTPLPTPAPPPRQSTQPQAANSPKYTPAQLATAQRLIQKGVLQPDAYTRVAEDSMNRAIAWATGKTK